MDADPTFHPDADPDSDPSFQIKTQTLEKELKKSHIPYILACHLQIDADPDPAYHFDADPDAASDQDADQDAASDRDADQDADPYPDFYLMRIQFAKMMRIRIHNTGKMCN